MSHPAEPAPATTPAAPPPPDSTQALAANLDDVMAQAEIAANARRDEDAGTPQVPAAAADEAQDDGDDEGEEDESTEEQESAEPAATAAPEADAPEAPAQPTYNRRDAARFAAELEQRNKDLTEARSIVQRATGEVAAMRAADQEILTALGKISGYTKEANGRYLYENLRDKVVRKTATDEEHQTVAEMTQWQELAGPIYRAAQEQVTRAFAVDWQGLKDLEGIGDEGLAKINGSANGVAGARELHALAYKAGQTAATTKAEQTIARLRAENKSLKGRAVTTAPQPAVVAGGAAPPNGTSFKDRAFKSDGSINEDFDREVRAGKWLGVDLANT